MLPMPILVQGWQHGRIQCGPAGVRSNGRQRRRFGRRASSVTVLMIPVDQNPLRII